MKNNDSMVPGRGRRRGLRGLAVMLGALAIAACVTAPPVQEMSDARQAIAAAEEAAAARHASDTFDEAQRYLATAERLLREESYGAARANAIRARDRAMRALSETQAIMDEEGADDDTTR